MIASLAPADSPAQLHDGRFVQRCKTLGLALVLSDREGRILGSDLPPDVPLVEAALDSDFFHRELADRAPDWKDQQAPACEAFWPGFWVIPIPLEVRRKRIGYRLVLALTAEVLRSRELSRICEQAGHDAEAMKARLRAHAFNSEQEVHRHARMLSWMARDLTRCERSDHEIEELSQQLSSTYEEISLLYSCSADLSVGRDPQYLLLDVCQKLQQVLGLQWLALQVTDTDPRLSQLQGELLLTGDVNADRATMQSLAHALVSRFAKADTTIVDDTASLEIPTLRALTGRALIVPLVRQGHMLGLLFGPQKVDGAEFTTVESKLADSLGHNIRIFLENTALYEDVHAMFMGTLRSLVSAIDAKDTYTRGHSERVAHLSRQLAQAAGLDEQLIERIYLSAMVHDVGKIGVPESVLCKPGKLTREEFGIIKTHPTIGARILGDIRQMRDLIPGVLHHHERYDGGGYPDGLSAEQIPYFGRLIALADSFDAMSSTRTYRPALSLEKTLSEIRENAGTQFDPDLAHTFVTLDFTEYHRLVAEHQERISPFAQVLKNTA